MLFWCLDKSCSMSWNGETEDLKQEFTQTLNSLSSQAEFGVVAFSKAISSGTRCPSAPTPPTRVRPLRGC